MIEAWSLFCRGFMTGDGDDFRDFSSEVLSCSLAEVMPTRLVVSSSLDVGVLTLVLVSESASD